MIDVKQIAKSKGASGSGSGGSTTTTIVQVAQEAKYAAEAGKATKATFAEQAEKANNAVHASRSDYASVAGSLDENSEVYNQFIRKDQDDSTAYWVTFLKGLKLGEDGKYYITAEGIAALKEIYTVNLNVTDDAEVAGNTTLNTLVTKALATLAQLKVTGDAEVVGNTTLNTLVTKALATLAQLKVVGDSEFDGQLSSKDFVSGFLTGKGWAIMKEAVTNAAGVEETKYTGEFDNLTVRGSLRVYEMIISQLLGENDNRVFTAMMEVDHYDPDTGKVYFDTQEGKLYNPFRKGDYIMVQQFNGMPDSSNDYYVTKHYELIITEVGVGSLTDGENRLDWAKFENFTASNGKDASEMIGKNDTFTRVDNLTDEERKGIIMITTVGSKTPYMDIAFGLKTDPDNALKGRLGNLQGIYHHLFGWLEGFGEYLNNLYAVGDFRLRRTGESLDQKIEAVKGMLSSQISQTTYEIKDNMLHNGDFALDLDGWTYDDGSTIITVGDEALLTNTALYSTNDSRVYITEEDGRKVLEVIDAELRQKVALITQPGTHEEYVVSESETATSEEKKEVADTLYLSIKYTALRAGTVTFGMADNTGTLATKTIDTEVDYEWHVEEVEGTWDGKGDFVLSVDGEIQLAFVALVSNPIDELSKTVSTNIEQTATNIRITGTNIDKANGEITQLGIDLDAEKKEIRTYVDDTKTELNGTITTTKSELTVAVGEVSAEVSKNYTDLDGRVKTNASNITINANSIKSEVSAREELAGTVSSNYSSITQRADSIESTVKSNYTSLDGRVSTNASLITQNATNISAEVTSREDADNSLSSRITANANSISAEVSTRSTQYSSLNNKFGSYYTKETLNGIGITESGITIQSTTTYKDADGNTTNIQKGIIEVLNERITLKVNDAYSDAIDYTYEQANDARDDAENYADEKDDAIKSGLVATGIDITSGTITFTANNIICQNNNKEKTLYLDSGGNLHVTGTITATAGKIAGFTISGNGLVNSTFANDAYVILRNDTYGCFAGIGGNIMPASTGIRAVARFENTDKTNWWGLGRNLALALHAENATYNHAFLGSGNGNLNGWIDGYKYSKFTCTTANTIYDGYAKISENNRWIIYSGVSSSGIALPKLTQVRDALGIGTTTKFCIRFTIVCDISSNNIYVYGRNKLTNSSNSTPWNTTELPLIVHQDGSNQDRYEMGAGDSIEFLLVYDSSQTKTINSYSTYYTARLISHLS